MEHFLLAGFSHLAQCVGDIDSLTCGLDRQLSVVGVSILEKLPSLYSVALLLVDGQHCLLVLISDSIYLQPE